MRERAVCNGHVSSPPVKAMDLCRALRESSKSFCCTRRLRRIFWAEYKVRVAVLPRIESDITDERTVFFHGKKMIERIRHILPVEHGVCFICFPYDTRVNRAKFLDSARGRGDAHSRNVEQDFVVGREVPEHPLARMV